MDEIVCQMAPDITAGLLVQTHCRKNMQYCIQKAAEDCMFVCDGIAPNDRKRLFETMKSADLARPDAIVDDLVIVKPQINAYKKATNRSTKTHILSL